VRRFSIASLMAFVLIFGVGLAALRNASELWAGMMLLVALGVVGAAVLGAIILRGRERAWWSGFALFAGGYMALAVGPWLSDRFQPQLGTTHLLQYVHGRLIPDPAPTAGQLQELRDMRSGLVAQLDISKRHARSASDPLVRHMRRELEGVDYQLAAAKAATLPYDQFEGVGHCLFALLAGVVGGLVATWFYARRERAASVAG